MATVLFTPVTFNLAETTRMIEIARALSGSHRAVFLGYEDDFVSLITDAGFECRPCRPAWSAAERDQALRVDQGKSLRSPFTTALVAARVAAERRVISDIAAQAVVMGTNLTSLISARAEGIPLFYAVPFALTHPQVEQTARLGIVPGATPWARGADLFATAAMRWLYTRAPLAPPAFARVSRALGTMPLRTISSLLEADHNLLTVMPWELDGYDLPPTYERVGPIYAHIDLPVPDLVGELAQESRPLVYLGLGSSASRGLVMSAARALGRLPINVIAPVGHYLKPGDELPPNVHLTSLLPAHKLGGLVDGAVLHGGQGTVQSACASGIPFVGMGLQLEQSWNVSVCVQQGNALAVSPRSVSRPIFAKSLRRVLTDLRIREAAQRVSRDFADENGAVAAARRIERFLAP